METLYECISCPLCVCVDYSIPTSGSRNANGFCPKKSVKVFIFAQVLRWPRMENKWELCESHSQSLLLSVIINELRATQNADYVLLACIQIEWKMIH